MNASPSGVNATAVTTWPTIVNAAAAAPMFPPPAAPQYVTVAEFPYSVDFSHCRTTGQLSCRDACCRPDLQMPPWAVGAGVAHDYRIPMVVTS